LPGDVITFRFTRLLLLPLFKIALLQIFEIIVVAKLIGRWKQRLINNWTAVVEMPSRKKAQGKARKAAKVKKEVEGRDEMSSLQAEMAQLWMVEKPGDNKCTHGSMTSLDQRTEEFLLDLSATFFADIRSRSKVVARSKLGKALVEQHQAVFGNYEDVCSDETKMGLLSSFIVARGSQYILDDSNTKACRCASLAYYLEQYTAVVLKEALSPANMNMVKAFELGVADKHTLVKFFKKRIPCTCLDHTYKEVKSIPKMGLCCNVLCDQPGRSATRKSMLKCTRCRQVNYCSRECQVAHWPVHKTFCDKYKDLYKRADALKQKS
jgi:hypothetical protein